MQTTKLTTAKVQKYFPHQKSNQQNLRLQKFQNIFSSKPKKQNRVDPEEMAHHQMPHLDLHCIQLQLFYFWCFMEKGLTCLHPLISKMVSSLFDFGIVDLICPIEVGLMKLANCAGPD